MKIKINGKEQTIEDNASISKLLESLGINKLGTAVAINEEIASRDKYEVTQISDGDRIEIIGAIGGG